jgi:hypothetical protein
MWRKNRRFNGGTSYGVDINRNFSVGFGGSGSSGTSTSDIYRGPSAFSEPESAALRNFCRTIPNLVGYIDYHSYAEKILWPYAYTNSPPSNPGVLDGIATSMVNSMVAGGGHAYIHGQASTTLYIASGTTKDYFYDTYGTKAYTIELRDTGTYGFLLPEAQIAATQDEAWAAFRELAFGTL